MSGLRTSIVKACVALVVSTCACGCPRGQNYPVTKRRVTNADVTGIWRYHSSTVHCTCEIQFLGNGEFLQNVQFDRSNVKPLHHRGQWWLSENRVVLNKVLLSPGGWTPLLVGWEFSDREGGGFYIVGGVDGDPDSYELIPRIDSEEPR